MTSQNRTPDLTALRAATKAVTRPSTIAAVLLAAGVITWAAVPISGATAGAKPALAVAVICGALSSVRLVAGIIAGRRRPAPADEPLLPIVVQWWRQSMSGLRSVPWPQGMIVAVLVLEALHRTRPWHTAVLGVALVSFLLVLHLAESGADLAALRPHVPLLVTGIGLSAAAAGLAAVLGTGSVPAWLSVGAALAAVIAAAIALPV